MSDPLDDLKLLASGRTLLDAPNFYETAEEVIYAMEKLRAENVRLREALLHREAAKSRAVDESLRLKLALLAVYERVETALYDDEDRLPEFELIAKAMP